ncbi:hypothetical protein [Pseudomonas peli]|uniref:hypothetical protein n=1 Tax=Pseudomonas peli TaxID=592361 RepID=UPI00285434CC|nr:hypothetical protein [Pseudomonas peli]MDR7024365.1 hypothetical protein [Pseudomonas peli]
MSKALELFKTLFAGPRDPRSAEYQAGCLYILRRKLDGIGKQDCPYRMPSAQADAWLAGCQEGLRQYQYTLHEATQP